MANMLGGTLAPPRPTRMIRRLPVGTVVTLYFGLGEWVEITKTVQTISSPDGQVVEGVMITSNLFRFKHCRVLASTCTGNFSEGDEFMVCDKVIGQITAIKVNGIPVR